MVGIKLLLNRPETGNAPGLENLYGLGLELVVAGNAFVRTHHALIPGVVDGSGCLEPQPAAVSPG